MRCSLAIAGLGLLGAVSVSGQPLQNNRPERYPPGSVGEASRQHALTLPEVRRLLDVHDALAGGKAQDPASREQPISDSASLTSAIAQVERSAAAMRALAAAKFSPAEYVVASSAFVEAVEIVVGQRILGPYAPPTRGRWENVALYRANQAELDKRLGLDDLTGGREKSDAAQLRALRREPGMTGAAAATHVLTMDEVRGLLTMLGDLESLARTRPDIGALLEIDDSATPLDGRAANLSRSPEFRAIAAKHGFTPRQYLVAQATFAELVDAVTMRGGSAGNAATPAEAKNVALYHQHEREIDALMGKVVAQASTDEEAALKADTVYQRRLRQTDRLSRFVRTDSLARLLLRGIDAGQDALPALGQEVTCEITRLHWRHGIAPAATAIRRMRDSVFAGRQEDYRRSNDRLQPYALSAPMTDAACHQSRWPRAADSLNVMPRPTDPTLR
jgi:hypothetical protein